MESYAKGDQVSLRDGLGPLLPGTWGIIFEEYGKDETPDDGVVGSKDFEGLRGEFDYGVCFTMLGGPRNSYNGPWFTDKVGLSQFFKANIVPMRHSELRLESTELRGVDVEQFK